MILVIAGVHRSGTSMVAGLLNHSGIAMGTHFRPALPENPMGFFEEEAFRNLNDLVLADSSYVVKQWSPAFNGLTVSRRRQHTATEIVRRHNGSSSSWGWKDPRNCLTLPLWLGALEGERLTERVKIIATRRDMYSVARSLFARGNVRSIEHGAEIWRLYDSQLTNVLRRLAGEIPVVELRYERFVRGNDLQLLESFCERRLDHSFVDPLLDRCGT